ncbi:MAG: threonine/serine dehydratase [Acidobacteriota bacterium]
MGPQRLVGLEDIRAARGVIAGNVHRTEVASSAALAHRTGCKPFLKQEMFQRTGAFKIRGALNRLASLSARQRAAGVCTVSAGNHAQGVALAARMAAIPCCVVMPENAARSKVEATEGYGAEVILHGDLSQIFPRVRQVEQERGMTFIHPFDHPRIIAGQGTTGLELVEDAPHLDIVVVPVGGGGLISGVAAAVKAVSPGTRVIGVEPYGADAMWRSLQSGKAERLERLETIADGLSAPFAGELTLAHVQALVDDLVRVTDDEMREAMGFLLSRCKLLAEPAGAAAAAALLAGKITWPAGPAPTVGLILSGGNIDLARLAALLGP